MKIAFKINTYQLDEIIHALKHERKELPNVEIVDKIYFYLFQEMFKKLLKKQIDISGDYRGNKFTMAFHYPLAAALYNELIKVNTDNEYRANCCRILINDLKQKLT